MINNKNIREIVINGLSDYLGCPVIRANQNVAPPKYPYGSFKVITPKSENKGTWQEHDDGISRKAVLQTLSFTFQSNKEDESIELAHKAHDWLDYAGTTYLNDNNIIVQSVTGVTNRDNFLTTEYEYRNGFDCFLWLYDEIEKTNVETIESIDLGNGLIEPAPTVDELSEKLEERLTGR